MEISLVFHNFKDKVGLLTTKSGLFQIKVNLHDEVAGLRILLIFHQAFSVMEITVLVEICANTNHNSEVNKRGQ